MTVHQKDPSVALTVCVCKHSMLGQAALLPIMFVCAFVFVCVPTHMIGKAWQPILPTQQLCCPNGEVSNCSIAGSTGGECVMHVQGQAGPRRKLDVPNSGASEAAQG